MLLHWRGSIVGGDDVVLGRSTNEIASSDQSRSLLWRMFGRVETKADKSIEMYIAPSQPDLRPHR